MVHKEEFMAWKSSQCYVELAQELTRSIEASAAKILNREVPDQANDQLLRGYIHGLKATLEWIPDFPPDPELDGDEDEV